MTAREFPRSQKIGTVWTVAYALFAGFGPTAFHRSDAESVLVLLVLPIMCLLAAFAHFRNGGYLAFGTLTLAMIFSIPQPSLYSMLALLIGGPLTLAWSLWLAYRAGGIRASGA